MPKINHKILKTVTYLMLSTALLLSVDLSQKSGWLNGIVFGNDSLSTLPNAVIRVENIPWAETNLEGIFNIRLKPDREYSVMASCIGYKSVIKKVKICPGLNEITFILPLDIIQFPSVTVEAARHERKKEEGIIVFSALDLNRTRTPLLQDPIKNLESDPVVKTENDFNSRISLRGGETDQVVYKIDGIPVFDIYHIGGLLSAINPDPASSVQVIYSGFEGVEYGRLSGIIDVNTLSEAEKGIHGKISLSLLAESYLLTAQTSHNIFCYLAYRRTHYNTAVRLVKNTFPYGFNDLNFKINWRINPKISLSLTGFQSNDYVTYFVDDSTHEKYQIKWGNQTLGLRWNCLLSKNISMISDVYATQFWNSGNISWSMKMTRDEITEYGFYQQLSMAFKHQVLHFGWQYSRFLQDYHWEFAVNKPDQHGINFGPYIYYDYAFPIETHSDKYDALTSWIDTKWNLSSRLMLNAALRFQFWESKSLVITPSVGYRLIINPKLSLSLNYDRMAQQLAKYHDRSPMDLMSLWFDNGDRFAIVDQYSAETRYQITSSYQVRLGTYLKNYQNIGRSINHGPELIYGKGQSYGAEVSFKKISGRIQYKLSYAYGVALIKFSNLVNYQNFDKPHRIYFENQINLTKRLFFTMTVTYSTGTPYYPFNVKYYKIDVGPGLWPANSNQYSYTQSLINNTRFPDYARMDVSLSYDTMFFKKKLSIITSVFNVTNRENIYYYYSVPGERNKDEYLTGLPLLPSLEIQWAF
jgi:hypothetical protein